jgi:hypothetical protein
VKGWKKIYHDKNTPQTGRSINIHIRQSKIQTYIGQTRQKRSLLNKRGNAAKGNYSYQLNVSAHNIIRLTLKGSNTVVLGDFNTPS